VAFYRVNFTFTFTFTFIYILIFRVCCPSMQFEAASVCILKPVESLRVDYIE
jgi:hypothetical protein